MYGPTQDRTPNLRLFSKAHWPSDLMGLMIIFNGVIHPILSI
jgi:hypothetical protein